MIPVDCRGLRLLIVGPYPPPFGGIASHLTMLIPGLKARGAEDIAIVTFCDEDDVEQIEGATLYRFAPRRHGRRLLGPKTWGIAAETARALAGSGLDYRRRFAEATRAALIDEVAARHSSDVVSFYQSDVSLAMMPCSRVWGRRRGLVLTVFGECYDNPAFFARRVGFVQDFFKIPSAIASSSHHCARSFAKYGVTRPIEAVYYGIDLDRFGSSEPRAAYRAELGVAPDELLITYMGRFNEEMGLGRLLEIGPALLQHLPHAKLLLAGARGPLGGDAAAFAAAYPGRVNVVHDVPFALQPAIYAASDIVLAPSADQHACMGMSIKEAMAASKPVIGSDAGGIPEAIVNDVTGILVPLDDSQHIDAPSLLAAIERLATDPTLRVSMGAAARQRAEALFAMDVTTDRMAQLFMAARPA
ncbi:MAG: glycosyltransferase family 4 protein [Sphingomonadaceae bacterium]|nr:glycosyltransferase family 4 protein [Sphingomonadaceae bacterium]